MVVADELAAAVRHLLPLRIRAVEFQDPFLTVIGDLWSMNLLGDWTWRRANRVVDWCDEEAGDAVWDLCGQDVRDVASWSGEQSGISLGLSNGSVLLALSDSSGYEPWTFRHNELPLIYVGEP